MVYHISHIGLIGLGIDPNKPVVDEAFLASLGKDAQIVGKVERDGKDLTFAVVVDTKVYSCRQQADGSTVVNDGSTKTYFDQQGRIYKVADGREVVEYDDQGRPTFVTGRSGRVTRIVYKNGIPTAYTYRLSRSRYVGKRRMRRWRRSRNLAKMRKLKLDASTLGKRIADLKRKLIAKTAGSDSVDKPGKAKKFETPAPRLGAVAKGGKTQTISIVTPANVATSGGLLALATHYDNASLFPTASGVPRSKASSLGAPTLGEGFDVSGIPGQSSALSFAYFAQPLFTTSDELPPAGGSPSVPTALSTVLSTNEPTFVDQPTESSPVQSSGRLVASARGSAQGEHAESGGLETFMPTGWGISRSGSSRRGKVRVMGLKLSLVDKDVVALDSTGSEIALFNASRFGMPLPMMFGVSNALTAGKVTPRDWYALVFVPRSKQGDRDGNNKGRQGRQQQDEQDQDGAVLGIG